MSLSHRDPNCTGEWGVRDRGESQAWVCDACGAIGYMSEATNDDAILENLRASVLAQLTREGQMLLEEG